MRLIWNHGHGLVDNGAAAWDITEKPSLPFEFDGIHYDDAHGHRQHMRGAGQHPLSPKEQMEVQAYVSNQKPPPAAPRPFAHLEAELSLAVQEHLDEGARAWGYHNMLSLLSYRSSNVKAFSNEACAAHVWRDKVWTYCHEQYTRIESGEREIPTVAAFVSELPDPVWPPRTAK